MDNYINEPLKILVNKSGNEVIMSWTGKCAESDPQESINPYLDSLTEDLKGTVLKIEMEKLKFMNTNTFQILIRFFRKLDADGIRTVVTYDSSAHWQHVSFRGLKKLTSMMKNISVQGV